MAGRVCRTVVVGLAVVVVVVGTTGTAGATDGRPLASSSPNRFTTTGGGAYEATRGKIELD